MAWREHNLYRLGGGVHGVYQVVEELAEPFLYQIADMLPIPLGDRLYKWFEIERKSISWRILRILWTFLLVDAAWVFFRAATVPEALYIIKQSLYIKNIGLILNGGLYQLGLNERNMSILAIGVIALFISSVMRERGLDLGSWIKEQNVFFRYFLYWGALMLIILSLDITGQEFIYFQF